MKISNFLVFFFFFISVITLDGTVGNCPELPVDGHCSCQKDVTERSESTTTTFTCDVNHIAKVANMFKASSNVTTIGTLILKNNLINTNNKKEVISIPANLVGNRTISSLRLHCPTREKSVTIHPDAFHSSSRTLLSVSVFYCDLSHFRWSFLENFTKLSSLRLSTCVKLHTHFYTLPSATLNSFISLYLDNMDDMMVGFSNENVQFPARVPNGLHSVSITNCKLGDDVIGKFFTSWISTSSSFNTLNRLILSGNAFSRIPSDVYQFKKLAYFQLNQNTRSMTLSADSFFWFGDEPSTLMLKNSRIENIEPYAFQGNYSRTTVVLNGNFLKTLDKDVFGNMLLDIKKFNDTGYIHVEGNRFDCYWNQCRLQWLFNHMKLISVVKFAKCSNGSDIAALKPARLAYSNGAFCYNSTANSLVSGSKNTDQYLDSNANKTREENVPDNLNGDGINNDP